MGAPKFEEAELQLGCNLRLMGVAPDCKTELLHHPEHKNGAWDCNKNSPNHFRLRRWSLGLMGTREGGAGARLGRARGRGARTGA